MAFIKKSWRTYKGKKYEQYHIVESVWDAKKKRPKHRYLMNVTHLDERQRELLCAVLNGEEVERRGGGRVECERSRAYGADVFVLGMLKELGVIEALREGVQEEALKYVVAIIVNRVLAPRSKLGVSTWMRGRVLGEFIGLEGDEHVNAYYRAMDELYEELGRVMEHFYKRGAGKVRLMLYDVTSTYMEGHQCEKAAYGYSRDHRGDRPQVVVGVVMNEEGWPMDFGVWEGNRQDASTVREVVRRVKARFGVEEMVFVGDRGMVREEILNELEGMGVKYIVAMKHRQVKQMMKDGTIPVTLDDRERPCEIYTEDGERYILCGGGMRRAAELAKLNAKLDRGKKELEKVVEMINAGRLKDPEKRARRIGEKLVRTGMKGFYDVVYEDGEARIVENEEAIKLARALAGYYVLRTTTELPPKKVEEEYRKLQKVERWFRDLKHVVRIRPVYHWKDRRVETHIFLCLLAQTVVAHIRKGLKACGWLDESPTHTFATFFDMLREVTVVDIRMGRKRMALLSRSAREVAPLLKKAFGFKKFDLTYDKKRYALHS